MFDIRRREFITVLGGAGAWPLAGRAEQSSKLLTIGYLGSQTPATQAHWLAAFLQRLRELACGADGIADFDALRAAVGRKGSRQAFLYAFDLLALDGEDVRPRPWTARREALASLLDRTSDGILLSEHIDDADGAKVFERELIRERTGEGRKRAKAAGVKFGRKRKLSDYQRTEAINRRAAGEETLTAIAKSYGVAVSMISRL